MTNGYHHTLLVTLILSLSLNFGLCVIFENKVYSKEEIMKAYQAVYEDLKDFDFSKAKVRFPENETVSFPQRLKVAQKSENYLNPGLAISLKEDILNKIQHRVVEEVYAKFKHIELPMSIEIPDVTLSDLKIDIDELKPQNLNLYLSPDDNSLVMDFQEIHMSTVGNIDVRKFVHLHGSVNVKVRLERMTVKVQFLDGAADSSGLFTPQVQVQLALFDVPKDDLEIKVNLKYIPDFVANLIISFIKGSALDSVREYVSTFIPGDGTAQVNQIIQQQYPQNIPISQENLGIDLDLSTLMTQKIGVLPDHFRVSLDGMVTSPKDKDFHRPMPAAIEFDPKDQQNVLLGISESLIDSAVNSLVNVEHQNIYSGSLGPLNFSLKSNLDQKSLTINSKELALNNMLVHVEAEYFGFTMKAEYYLNAGALVNWIDLNQGRANISITRVKVTDYQFDCNIPLVKKYGYLLKDFIEAFGVLVKGYEVGFRSPKLPLGLSFSKIQFELREGYMVILTDLQV